LSYKYHDAKIDRLAYVHNFGADLPTPEEREELWVAEEPEEAVPEELTEDELKKRDEERAKKAQEESDETAAVAKRKGYRLYIHGRNFMKHPNLQVQFGYNQSVF